MKWLVAVYRRWRGVLIFVSGICVATVVVFGYVVGLVVAGFSGTAVLPADCAIVFGAAVHPLYDSTGHAVESQSGPGIQRRMLTAVELYKQGKVHKLFLSGGKGDRQRRSEAQIMMQYAILRHIPHQDVVAESQSTTTKENILYTRPLTRNCTSVIAISDRYHLTRIGFLAKQQGWTLPTFPAKEVAALPFEAKSVLREALAILWYGLFEKS